MQRLLPSSPAVRQVVFLSLLATGLIDAAKYYLQHLHILTESGEQMLYNK